MYCYVLKLLFLITQSYFPKQAATSIYSEVREYSRKNSFHAQKNANFYISVVIHEGLHLSEHPLYYMYIRVRSRFKIQIGHAK